MAKDSEGKDCFKTSPTRCFSVKMIISVGSAIMYLCKLEPFSGKRKKFFQFIDGKFSKFEPRYAAKFPLRDQALKFFHVVTPGNVKFAFFPCFRSPIALSNILRETQTEYSNFERCVPTSASQVLFRGS